MLIKLSVADPEFPVVGRGPRRGAWTHEAATFRKICMSKRKNRIRQWLFSDFSQLCDRLGVFMWMR